MLSIMENLTMADDNLFPDSFEEETPFPEQEAKQDVPENKEPAKEAPSKEEPVKEDDEHLWEATSEDLEEEEETATPESSQPNHLTLPQNIPFPIVVEVGRIKMSLEKLLQLQPGNVLETSVRPEQGVYLTVHGKRIAKGELVKVGDVLGVKILTTQE